MLRQKVRKETYLVRKLDSLFQNKLKKIDEETYPKIKQKYCVGGLGYEELTFVYNMCKKVIDFTES